MGKLSGIVEGVKAAKKAALDMSRAARMERANQLGYTQQAYSGSTHDIREFRGSLSNPDGDWGRGSYATTSSVDASENYAGVGPDLTNRIGSRAERIADDMSSDEFVRDEYLDSHDISLDDYLQDEAWVAERIARAELVGDAEHGVVYPLRINTSNYAVIGGDNSTKLYSKNYYDEARTDIDPADYDNADDLEDAIAERAREIEADDPESIYAKVRDALSDTDIYSDEVTINSVMEDIGDYIADGELDIDFLDDAIRRHVVDAYDDNGDLVSSGGISAQVLKNLGFDGVVDNKVNLKFGQGRKYGPGVPGLDNETQHIVTFPGKENNLRSEYAAFDPEKRHLSDLLAGGSAAAVLAGGAGYSPESEAGPVKVIDEATGAVKKALDMSQAARMERARAQGFDTERVLYRGSYADESVVRPGTFITEYPDYAAAYAKSHSRHPVTKEAGITWRPERGEWVSDQPNITPVYVRAENPAYGADSLRHQWTPKKDGSGQHDVAFLLDESGRVLEGQVFKPENMRSIYAAFDPEKRHLADLLAGGAGAAVLAGGAGYSPESEAGPVKVIDEATGAVKTVIESWHGSPYSFDRFDMSKIGTGEGAQAYGHGLYSADARTTGESYREALSSSRPGTLSGGGVDVGLPAWLVNKIDDEGIDAAISEWGKRINEFDLRLADPEARQPWLIEANRSRMQAELDAMQMIRDGGEFSTKKPGSLYRVHIDADPDSLLDWDKPLSEQPGVLSKLGDYAAAEDVTQTGGDFYKALSREYGGEPYEISAALLSDGIPGIRYRDGVSRNQAPVIPDYDSWRGYNKGGAADTPDLRAEYDAEVQKAKDFENNATYNYVTFDDSRMKIVEKLGIAGGAAGVGALAGSPGEAQAAAVAQPTSDDDAYVNQLNDDLRRYREAATSFNNRRAAKSEYWKQRAGEMLDMAGQAAAFAGDSIDLPFKGLRHLFGTLDALQQGRDMGQSLQSGREYANSTSVWEGLDKPLRGFAGIGSALGALTAGASPGQAVAQGAQTASQPYDQTVYGLSGGVVDSLSQTPLKPIAPAVGTGLYTGLTLGAPL